jgi:hypothetical protein
MRGVAYRMCRGKWRYRDEADARAMMTSIRRRRGAAGLRPYECPLCGGFHITHQPEQRPVR